MKKRLLIVMALLCLLQSAVFAQTDTLCGFDGLMQSDSSYLLLRKQLLQEVQDFREQNSNLQILPNGATFGYLQPSGLYSCRKAQYLIPVRVHVIHEWTDTVEGVGSNVSDAQIESALRALNAHFANDANTSAPAANTGIQFFLVNNSTTRRYDALTSHRTNQADSLMAIDYVDHNRCLNIWVVKRILDNGGNYTGIAGYATMPNSRLKHHGIVVDYRFFGNKNDCSGCPLDSSALGGVLTHEAGHFLGLFHPFDAGCVGMNGLTCATEGDMCCDVPPVAGQSFDCNPSRNTCHETPDLSDQVGNYMDYSEESCKTTITKNQAEIMQAVLNKSRSGLAKVSNINLIGVQGCHKAATFEVDKEIACIPSESFNLTAIDYPTASLYRWYFYQGSTLVYYDQDSNNFMGFYPAGVGTFTVKLVIEFSSSSDSVIMIRENLLEAANCDTSIANPQASWAFGYYGGLTFTKGGAFRNVRTAFQHPNNIFTSEGSISQANAVGQMLFYAAGYHAFFYPDSAGTMAVYNKGYEYMLNSSGIYGDESATQVGLSIPLPGDGKKYYLICNNSSGIGTKGIHFSVIDTSLDAGKGAVIDTLKNVPVSAPWFISDREVDSALISSEGMTAIPQCNGTDYWLIVQPRVFSADTFKGFLVYSLTASGINYHSAYSSHLFYTGHLKASPNGRYITIFGNVYEFDRENGNVSELVLSIPNIYTYGTSFSPDSRLLYLAYGDSILKQYDLLSDDPVASAKTVASGESFSTAMQLGPDSKLYLGGEFGSFLNKMRVINYPNLRDTVTNACSYTRNGPRLANMATVKMGLPNMVDAKKVEELPKGFDVAIKGCTGVKLLANLYCAGAHKWYFGDGDSSVEKTPTHTYTTSGSYTITLVRTDTTISKIVNVGNFQTAIAGDTLFCDTPTVLYLSTTRNADYSYDWAITSGGGTLASSNNESEIAANWTDEGTVRLMVKDLRSGCIDTSYQNIYRRVPPIVGNVIDTDQFICTTLVNPLKGERATGGSGTITYEWRKKQKGQDWEIIPGATDTFYIPQPEDSTLYVRVAKSGGCEKYSNVLVVQFSIRNNYISVANRACIAKDSFTVNGSLPVHNNDTVFNYSWEYSLDSLSWDSIALEHNQNIKWSYPADSLYLRRKVIASPSACEHYSNVLKVHPLIYFIKQPRSKPVCRYHPGEYVAFDSEVGLHKDTAVALHYFWQVKASNDSSPWNDTTTYNPATDTSYRYFSHSFTGAYEDSVRCIVFTPCGKIYSTIAIMYIIIDTIDYEFVIPPTSDTVSEGGSAYFTTYLNSDHGFEYFWQESKDGGETWQTIPGETDIDITINNVTRCMNKTKYRLAVFNGCYNWYSDPATLTVTSSYVNSLMMRDATDDTGTEPYPNNNIWASPDIWFSRNPAATYDYNNNNIEYKKLTPIGYAKVQVKNTGSTTSPAQKVVVHWTIASTLELWPKHWLSTPDNIFVNGPDTFFRGGVIDTVAIGPMTAGSTQVIVLPWEVPSPAWYGVNGVDSSLMVCLLGRILTCDEKPYGMTFPEGLVTATNARNNRKIITRNFHVVDTASGDMQGKPGGGNYWAQNMNAAYNLKAVSCDYFDYGVVDIVMDDVLSNAWYANGAHGSGFTVIDDHTIRITDTCDVWLTDVAFGPNEETQVKIHFVTDESYERTTPVSFDFEWYQYNQDSLALDTPLADGGMMLRCDLPDNVAAHYLDNQILVTSSGIPYKHSICNGATPPPLIGSNPVTPSYWTYQWQSTTDTMGVWTDIPGATDRDFNPYINNMNMFYRRGALKQHALALNYSPIFFMRLRDPMILTHPSNANVDEGDIASFIVSYQDMEVVNWTRTHSSIGAIIDETSDTLNFQTQECYNGNTFQAVLRDVCTSVQTSTSSATLTVNPVSDNLYAQDNTSGSFIWSSPDMINRRDNDGGSTHQTPEFGYPNYIYTTVRNNGMDASAPAKLHIYWSVATTGAAWERNWRFDTTESAETGNWIMYQGAKTPLGGLIGVYDIPSIASSSNYRSEIEWNPIDPAVYGLENTTLSDIILLGRIVTCEDEPYGMNPPEVNDLAFNVRYNERIISKHKIVTDVIPGNDVIHKAGNGNINDISMDGMLVFKALDCDYFQYGYVLLHTDATLQSIWTNSDGSGYTIVDDSTLQVDSCQNALLWDIGYGANQRTWLGVEFVTWDTLTVDTTENYYFEFDLEQYMNGDNDTSVGGIRYGVPIHLEPPAPESLIGKEDPKERITFTAYPNPFRDEMNITYKLPQDANVSITVVNMLGQQVRVLEQGNLKTAGTHRLLLNSSFLKEGIYFINFTAGSFTQTQKVVLIR